MTMSAWLVACFAVTMLAVLGTAKRRPEAQISTSEWCERMRKIRLGGKNDPIPK